MEILKGVENTATAVTTLVNTQAGAALGLEVLPGNPPLTVNEDAGTATNLSADTVDGKHSTAFVSATDGKAPDSELLDGKDPAKFLGANAKAADSDKLDGKDSTDFAAASTGTAFTARTAQVTIPNDGRIGVVSKNVPAGSYAINAKVSLVNEDDDNSADVGCALRASGNVLDVGRDKRLNQNPHINTPESDTNISESYPLQAVLTVFGGRAITITCSEGPIFGDSDRVEAFDAVIMAIRVGSVQ